MIGNIQALRGLAALAVVFYHTSHPVPLLGVRTEFEAVAVFFVISGFVMTYIPRTSPGVFVVNRFTRIVPFYWIITLFFFVWAGSGLMNVPYTFPVLLDQAHQGAAFPFRFLGTVLAASSTPDRLAQLAKSLLFVPQGIRGGPVLGVGWSLNLELFYYAVFALALAVSRDKAPLIVAVVLLALQVVARFCFAPMWAWTFSNNIQFVAGIGLCYLWRSLPEDRLLRGRSVYTVLAVAVLLVYVVSQGWPDIWLVNLCRLPFAVVFAMLILHSLGRREPWRWLLRLGDASYALYLTHGVLRETTRPFGDRWPALDVGAHLLPALGLCVIAVLLALPIHAWVERPLIAWVRRMCDHGALRPRRLVSSSSSADHAAHTSCPEDNQPVSPLNTPAGERTRILPIEPRSVSM